MKKVIWLDVETTSLDQDVASVLELAYIPLLWGEKLETRSYKIQPVLHNEDREHKGSLKDFILIYNNSLTKREQAKFALAGFSFDPNDDPLFMYSKSVLTFNMTPPDIINPETWLLDHDRIQPIQAIRAFVEDIESLNVDHHRWVLAGHNVSFDLGILSCWIKRAADLELQERFNKLVNKLYVLDTLEFSRWLGYLGLLDTNRYGLAHLCKIANIPLNAAHTAKADIEANYELFENFVSLIKNSHSQHPFYEELPF